MSKNLEIPLDKFQQGMQHLLLDPYQKTGYNPIVNVVNHSDRLSSAEHIAIYQRSYIARLRGCMSQQFSALEYALGQDLFRAFADDYLALHPSHNYNLSSLGVRFAEHLEATRPDAEGGEKEDWIDFMIELAKFEYAIGLIFDEKADEHYQLAKMDDPEDKLKLVPVFYLFKFRFPIREFYTAFKNGNHPDLPHECESACVVLRDHFKLAIFDLHNEQYELLSNIKDGMDVPTAKAEFKHRYKETADAFDQAWPHWKMRWVEAKFFRLN